MTEDIEGKIKLLQDLLTCARNIWSWSYDSHFRNMETNCPDAKILGFIFSLNIDPLLERIKTIGTDKPIVLTDSMNLIWIIDTEPNSDAEAVRYHVIGPVFVEDISSHALADSFSGLHLPLDSFKEYMNVMESVPVMPITRFFEFGLMLHFCITGERISVSDLHYSENAGSQKGTNQNKTDTHGTWALEQELLHLIEEGNMDYRKEAGKLVNASNITSLGNGVPLRNFKNNTIIFTALCARAAVRGGLTTEVAYSLSDKYINGIEACTSLAEVAEINSGMQDDFVRRVHQCKSEKLSSQIQKCCEYIQIHVGDDISVAFLASHFGYSPNYLSKKFKAELNMTVSEYIAKEKIGAAKDLLISGDTKISIICDQLGFGSQSYFSELFKKYTGFTPVQYRNKIKNK